MKIFVLTNEIGGKHGWGRYSADVISALESQGVSVLLTKKILPNSLSYTKNYFLAPWYALRMRKEAINCDAIHSFIEPYSYIAYWLSKFTGKKYFITAHGTYGVLPYLFPFYKRHFHKKSFGVAEKIICVSNYTKRRLSHFKLENLEVINNGIDINKSSQEDLPVWSSRQDILIGVGALKYRKGYHLSLRAFADLSKNFPTYKYYVIGDQSDVEYLKELKKLVSYYNLEDRVVFKQNISDKELFSLYKESKIFILPSVSGGSYFEGFGIVYLEAGAFGLPVIGSLDTGAEDAIKNGETGILVPQNNHSILAESISKILKDRSLAEKMSENGVNWSKCHDWKNIIPEYIRIYNQVK